MRERVVSLARSFAGITALARCEKGLFRTWLPRTGPTLVLAGLSAGIVSWTSPASAQSAPPSSEAEACFQAGERAQPLLKERRLRAAQRELTTCARDACPRAVRSDCRNWLDQVMQVQPTVVFRAREAKEGEDVDVDDVRVWVDGELVVPQRLDDNPVAVDPGRRSFRFEHPGFSPVEQRLELREGESRRLVEVTFRAQETGPGRTHGSVTTTSAPKTTTSERTSRPARPVRRSRDEGADTVPPATWTLLGASAIAAGVGVYFEAVGLSNRSHLTDTCGLTRSCAASDVDAARNQVRAGDIALGVSAALLAGAIYIYLSREPADGAHASVGLRLGWEPMQGGFVAGLGGCL